MQLNTVKSYHRTIDGVMVQTRDYFATDDSTMATIPSDSLAVEHSLSRTSASSDHTASDVGRCKKELRVMTSVRGNHASSSRIASVDSGRSEDDDGYCSRSSLDSPVQTLKQDNAASSGEDADALELRICTSSQSDLASTEYSDCHHSAVLQSTDDENGQSTVVMKHSSCGETRVEEHSCGDEDTHATAAVMSLDHSYLLLPSVKPDTSQSHTTGLSTVPVDVESVSNQSEKLVFDRATIQPLTTLFGGITKSLSNNRRNFSVYVVPRAVQSLSAVSHCETKLVPVAPVVNSRSVGASYNRWNARSCNDSLPKGSLKTVKKELMNSSLDRPMSLSYQISDTSLSPGTALVQDNFVNGTFSSGENYLTSLKSSLAHRPDQFKPGVTTGRCRIALSELSRRSPLVGVSQQKGATSARTGSMYIRTSQSLRGPSTSGTLNRIANRISDTALRLHPLVDHDYGAFATFNAEIQSSIISTTADGASQMDWRSVRKSRLGRTKTYRTEVSVIAAPAELSMAGSNVETPPAVFQVRQKRKYCRRQPVIRDVIATVAPKLSRNTKLPGKKGRPPLGDSRRLSIVKKRTVSEDISSAENNGSQSFVKIPGQYQNEFVYYATKRTRGRPRKQTETLNPLPTGTESSSAVSKPATSVGGINVFDWYREMAQTDKSSRFGTSCQSTPVSSLPGTVHWTSGVSYSSADNGTPADESAVADLVMEMLPKTELVLGKGYRTGSASCGVEYSSDAGNFAIPSERSEINVTEEDVCAAMLQSLNEADLKMIETQLGVGSDNNGHRSSLASGAGGDVSFTQYLPDYGRDSLLSLSQTSITSTSNGLLDVDEINDSDLLTADLGNMNVLLNDLSTPTRDVRVSNASVGSRSNLSALFDLSSVNNADYGSTSTSQSEPEAIHAVRTLNASLSASPPELITVNMFWNDVPGLMIRGQEYVRLVDIHRQMLPAKDTGILKKRCQMLALDVQQCSELQRDFLIRYMNAAKSKSTAIVARRDAIELIGFYVNPKSKTVRYDDKEVSQVAESLPNVGKDNLMLSSQATNKKTINADQTLELHASHTLVAAPEQSCNNDRLLNSVSPNESQLSVKRSERLRDKHVRYADMVLGFHQRHSTETESDHIDAQTSTVRPKRAADFEAAPLRLKFRRISGDVKASSEDDNGVNQVKQLGDNAKPIYAVQHSHRTRLASSSDSSAGPTETNFSCERVKVHVAPKQIRSLEKTVARLQNDSTDNSDTVMLENSSAVTNTAVNVLENRRNSMLHRVHRLHSRRRRRGASLIRHAKGKNVSRRQDGKMSTNICAFWSSSSPTACEDFKENLSIEGHVADNADINTLKKDIVEVTDSFDSVVEDNQDNHCISTIQGLKPSVSCETGGILQSTDIDMLCEGESFSHVLTPLATERLSTQPPHLKPDVSENILPQVNSVKVRHCDIRCRLGRRRRSQNGCIVLDRFTWSGAKCVRCDTCGKLFSVSSFVAHMHLGGDREKLMTVNSLQRFEPRGLKTDEWLIFERLQASFGTISLIDSSVASHDVSIDLKSDLSSSVPQLSVSGVQTLSVHLDCQDPLSAGSVYDKKVNSKNPPQDILPSQVACDLHQEKYPPPAVVSASDPVIDTEAYDKVNKPLVRRSVRASNSTLDIVSFKSRNNCSSSCQLSNKTNAVLGLDCESHANMHILPMVDKKVDLKSLETRGRLRQNYQRRSPPGATVPK